MIWKRIKANISNVMVLLILSQDRKGRSGEKRKNWSEYLQIIKDTTRFQRGTFRSLFHACNVPRTSLLRLTMEGDVKQTRKHCQSNFNG